MIIIRFRSIKSTEYFDFIEKLRLKGGTEEATTVDFTPYGKKIICEKKEKKKMRVKNVTKSDKSDVFTFRN